jgi:hypothetical protein
MSGTIFVRNETSENMDGNNGFLSEIQDFGCFIDDTLGGDLFCGIRIAVGCCGIVVAFDVPL